MRQKAVRVSLVTLLLVGGFFFGTRAFLYYSLEDQAITTRANGPEVPDDFGAPSEQISLASGTRTLRASVVRADVGAPAVLLYHGRRESISRYAEVQALLYREGITSMVFDYSGFGDSSGEPTIENIQEDGINAWSYFNREVAAESSVRTVMGHSLGTGILMSGVSRLTPKPDLVVLSAPWSTARSAVIHLGMVPEEIYYLLPDVWNNLEAARELSVPLLVVHGTDDRIVPQAMGRRVAEEGNGRFVSLEGVDHRQLIRRPDRELWQPILDAIRTAGK